MSEKLAQGDRAVAAGDLRGALFAYQDAVYLQPGYAFARVKLGRAYLALRYADQAIAQGEKALALDPGSGEARRLLEEARTPTPRAPQPAIPAAAPVAAASPAPRALSAPAAETSPRVYRLPDPGQASDAAPPASTSPRVVIVDASATGGSGVPRGAPPAAQASGAELYRLGVDLVARRDYGGAIDALNGAIARDPRLGVAYAARASAEFGLQRYRDAADDYKAALGLDPELATPLYGLGECYRLLGDPAAVEMYERYAASRSRDVREDLRVIAAKRAKELSRR